jgi:predicted transport protein
MKYKKQHFIPESYLESWCDSNIPEGYNKYVWMFDYSGEIVKKKSPNNIFHESDMYTIFDNEGKRILDIEHGLSGLESKFASIRDNILAMKQDLTEEDKYYILAFVAAIHNRTVATKEHLSREWGRVLDLGKLLKQEYENASPEKQKDIAAIGSLNNGDDSFSLNDVENFHNEPMQTLMIPSINAELNCYTKMHMSILNTDDEIGFITSDDPCIWFDPESYKIPPIYRSVGLGNKKVEVTLPISPQQAIFISHTPLSLYIPVNMKTLDSINRKTRFSADRYFIVNRNDKKDFWFKVIEPPSDLI